jgi:hypothetical protein
MMKILMMKMMILQAETHPMMKVEIQMTNQTTMKTMALMLRTMFSCGYPKPSITLHVITNALPLRMTPKSKFTSWIPLMDPNLGSCVHSLFNASLISEVNPRPSIQTSVTNTLALGGY